MIDLPTINNYSIEELEEFISRLPSRSNCERADKRMFENLLDTKKQQLQQHSTEIANGIN